MELKKESNRIYLENPEGKTIAEITFLERDNGVVEIDHTLVDDSLRGQGIAGKLVQQAADQLRAEGKKAVVTCSYAMKWFQKHPEYQDLLIEER